MSDDLRKITEDYEAAHVAKGDAATKKDVEQLGIGYTPKEIVNFMTRSVAEILRDEFNTELGAPNVIVSDPFAGTGRFLVGLVESETIPDEDLKRKYHQGEINGQEILPASHEIAKRNIEKAYHDRVGEGAEFNHLRLGDTFEDGESFYKENKTRYV